MNTPKTPPQPPYPLLEPPYLLLTCAMQRAEKGSPDCASMYIAHMQ